MNLNAWSTNLFLVFNKIAHAGSMTLCTCREKERHCRFENANGDAKMLFGGSRNSWNTSSCIYKGSPQRSCSYMQKDEPQPTTSDRFILTILDDGDNPTVITY
jgi:hypothetical protein